MIIKAAKYAFLLLGLAFGASSIYFYASWQHDNAKLRTFASDILGLGPVTDQEIDQLNTKVYHTEGFAKNHNYFLLKQLGATPLQILKKGGDCADKSRLVAAILGNYGVPASLVMLAPCKKCSFVHTVVEAHPSDGPIVVDPVYDMSFPKPNGGYYDLQQLQKNPDILQDRLKQLVSIRGEHNKIAYYHKSADGSHYGFPKTINLDKNGLTKAVKDMLSLVVSRPQQIYRPRFLEDPKLFLTLAAGSASGLAFVLSGILFYADRRRRRRFRRASYSYI